jgi:hypothetical protein
LAIDRYDLLYIMICSAFELIMSYKGGAGKDFFSSQTCHSRLLIAFFGLAISPSIQTGLSVPAAKIRVIITVPEKCVYRKKCGDV